MRARRAPWRHLTLQRDMPEGQAWNELLGLDGFDPFPNDSSPGGLSFLGSSSADAFSLTAMDFSMPTGPHHTLHPAADVNIPKDAGWQLTDAADVQRRACSASATGALRIWLLGRDTGQLVSPGR